MSNRKLLRIEGVNFDNTIFDTDDLSTIRGSSWALLSLPDQFASALSNVLAAKGEAQARVDTVFSGASTGLYSVETTRDTQALEAMARACLADPYTWPREVETGDTSGIGARDLLPYLVFVVSAVPEDDHAYGAAERILKNRALVRRLQVLDVDVPTPMSRSERVAELSREAAASSPDVTEARRTDPDLPCVIDRIRPRGAFAWRSTESGPRQDVPVSRSVFDRKTFGRTGRRKRFYEQFAEAPKDWNFLPADSFEEIASDGFDALSDRVPSQLRERMAVLYMDGNAFGQIRRLYLGDDKSRHRDRATQFSRDMGKHREALLSRLRATLENDCALQLPEPSKKVVDGERRPHGQPVLRFETLLWGGDESLLVFPAWGLATILGALEGTLVDSQHGRLRVGSRNSVPLSYGIGVVLCHYKTPIGRAKDMAEELAENAKARARAEAEAGADHLKLQSFVDVMTLAGYEIPMSRITAVRESSDSIPEKRQPQTHAIPLMAFSSYLATLSAVRGRSGDETVGVPRRKLFDVLRCLRRMEVGDEPWPFVRKGWKEIDGLFSSGKYETEEGRPIDGDFFDSRIRPVCQAAPPAFLLHMRTLWDHLG